ncbi:MAG: ABC transporter permease [Chloroflexota bacterium]|nr:ABC transporter permease [Chloroflexota bacterium]
MKALVIARLTFREALRKRMIWGVLLLSLVFAGVYYWGYTVVRADFSEEVTPEGQIITFDFVSMILVGLGFYTINFLAGVMTIFAAVGTVAGEIESGTFQAIVTKPLARWELILGKFLGFAGMIAVYIVLMAVAVLATARRVGDYTPANWPAATGLVILVSLILLALTMLGSTLLQTMANGVVVFMLYGGALLGGLLEQLGSILNIDALVTVGIVTSLILPSDVVWRLASSLLQPSSSIRLDSPIPIAAAQAPSQAMVNYAVAYVFVALGLAMLSFRRRDL